MVIGDIKEPIRPVTVEGIISSLGPVEFTETGRRKQLGTLTDGTGSLGFSLWEALAGTYQEGDRLCFENCQVVLYEKKLELKLGLHGKCYLMRTKLN